MPDPSSDPVTTTPLPSWHQIRYRKTIHRFETMKYVTISQRARADFERRIGLTALAPCPLPKPGKPVDLSLPS
jgi:hypothetical protein